MFFLTERETRAAVRSFRTKTEAEREEGTVPAEHCVCSASDAAFGHLSPRLMCRLGADC